MKLHEMIKQKRQWRAHTKRVKTLPRDYQIVYNEMQKYLFNVGPVDYEQCMNLLTGIVDLFEEGASAGKDVLAVTGRDVAAFCDGLLADIPNYADRALEQSGRATAKAMQAAARKLK